MYTLIPLPYAPDGLEPVISERTLSFHHGKHLQAYVDNLNKLLPGTGLEDLPLTEIVRKSSGPLFNNAGQVLNHNLYFTQFAPAPQDGPDSPHRGPQAPHRGPQAPHRGPQAPHRGLDPRSPLSKQITAQWGTLAAFQAEFEARGTALFGSGWVWLSADADGTLHITQEPGAGNPVTRGLRPLLTFDVWEHAYYLDYQNRRAAHLHALWDIVNWEEVEARYSK